MSYPGGKGGAGVAQIIINQQPPHRFYVEPFLGFGTIMRIKRPATLSLGLDRDPIAVEQFTAFAFESLPGAIAWCQDGIEWLEDRGHSKDRDTLVYCDPPYLIETRRSSNPIYRCELDEARHRRFLAAVLALDCMVQISGYWSSLYAQMLEGWRLIRFQSMTRGGPAEECLWMNYPEPKALHDYRFLGRNFRQRERIRRKTLRWTTRIAALPDLERLALFSAIASTIDGSEDARSRDPIAEGGEGGRRASAEMAMSPANDRTSPEAEVLQ